MNLGSLDNNVLFIIVGSLVTVMGLLLVIFALRGGIKGGNRLSNRLDEFVTPPPQTTNIPAKGMIIPRQIEGSLFSRTIASWFKSVLNFLGKYTPKNVAVDLDHKLSIAGNPANLHAAEFYAIRFLVLMLGIFLAYFINRDFKHLNMSFILFGVLIILISFLLPSAWLDSKVRNKKDEIRRGLPDALDMLSVCASAGLGFDQSLQKISSYWESDLGYELKRTIGEMEMGVPRSVALRNMSDRLDVDDLTRFISIIIQAETVGMSYAEVLHNQADQMRIMRQYRAREIANKLPAKMIIPLAVCIFPALLAVILGPVIPTLLSAF